MKFFTCPECEATFSASQLVSGAIPPHSWQRKPCPGSGTKMNPRKRNPIQGGERLEMLREAAKLYREFTGDEGELVAKVRKLEWPKVAAVIGEMDGVLYSTVRDGVDEKYIHKFKAGARPLLCTSHDGKMLIIVLGKYRFTDRGIVDG